MLMIFVVKLTVRYVMLAELFCFEQNSAQV